MDLRRRLKRIEKELHIGKRPKPHVLVFFSPKTYPESEAEHALPKNVKEWVLYQQQVTKCPTTQFVLLFARDEVEAREKLRKTTKFNKTAKSEAQI